MSSYYFVGQSFAGPITGTTGTFSGAVTATGYTASAATAFTATNATPIWNSTAATSYLIDFQNNGVDAGYIDKSGNLVPASVVSTSVRAQTTFLAVPEDFDLFNANAAFNQNGNVTYGAVNSVTAPLMDSSTFGVWGGFTSSTTAGGYLATTSSYPVIKSSSITYYWRIRFYLPAASTSANRYTAHIGGCNFTGTANNTLAGAFTGPHVSYSDNLNSGNWVLASSVNGTRVTGNSSTAATANAWHIMQISLSNGTYTFIMDGVNIGTLADANITTSVAANQAIAQGGIAIVPDGANFTTQRTLLIDRAEFWATGLSR